MGRIFSMHVNIIQINKYSLADNLIKVVCSLISNLHLTNINFGHWNSTAEKNNSNIKKDAERVIDFFVI